MIKLTLNKKFSTVVKCLQQVGFNRYHFIQGRDGTLTAYMHRRVGDRVQSVYVNNQGVITHGSK